MDNKQKENVLFVLKWVNRMSKKYGPSVKDKDGSCYDWGQALCRECYGPDWGTFMAENNIRMPGDDEVEKAKQWESGKIPDWVVYQDSQVEKTVQYKLKKEYD